MCFHHAKAFVHYALSNTLPSSTHTHTVPFMPDEVKKQVWNPPGVPFMPDEVKKQVWNPPGVPFMPDEVKKQFDPFCKLQ